MKTILIVGLGNPGKKYAGTRHNAGFLFVDFFWEKYRDEFEFSNWEFKRNLNAEISIGKIGDKKEKIKKWKLLAYAKSFQLGKNNFGGVKLILLKPQAFMNLSGEAVKKALKFYKLKPENLIVAHDDIDLQIGKYKISKNSSSAGHNGVQNIINRLGTKDFARIRIGVENREDKKKIPTEKYVLGKFTNGELKTISEVDSKVSDEFLKN